MTIDGTRRASSPEPVTSAIRDAILSADFAPGQRLVEADLSAEFGASRSAVRAALLTLTSDGLVEREANRGARVRVVPLEEAIEIYEVRMAVESLCAAKASQLIDAAEIEELEQIGSDMQVAVKQGDVFGYSALNQRLHLRVREISRQHTAMGVLDRLRAQIVRHQFRLATQPGRPQVSLPEHLAIIEAVCSHDSRAASAAVERHLGSVIEAMRQFRSATGATRDH